MTCKLPFKGITKRGAKRGSAYVLALMLPAALIACGGDGDPDQPAEVRYTHIGEADSHIQIGKVGILYGQAYAQEAQRGNTTLPARVLDALKAGGATFDYMLLGHHHPDHNVNSAEVQKLTKAKFYASAEGCAASNGGGTAACESVKGGEVIELGKYVKLYPIRYVHGVGCAAQMASNGGITTLAFLLVADTTLGRVSMVLTDSGSGRHATVPVTIDGVTSTAEQRFQASMKLAGIEQLDFMTVGPEGRFATQVALFAPQFKPKTFMLTHHGGTEGTFNGERRAYDLLGGLAYTFKKEDSPQLMKVLRKFPEIKFNIADNFFEAYSLTTTGFNRVANPAVKTAMGYDPVTGAGPKAKSPTNFRDVPPPSGIDCPADDALFAQF